MKEYHIGRNLQARERVHTYGIMSTRWNMKKHDNKEEGIARQCKVLSIILKIRYIFKAIICLVRDK
jgi:hypothetical protein